jgi:transposase
LRHALNELAMIAPQWLKAQVTSDWFDRYGARFEQYRLPQEKAAREQLLWREPTLTGLPGNKILIQSPYDSEARNRTKRNTNWTGYTVHLTETCEENSPNLITNVETTPATTPDGAMTQIIHQHLAQKELLPAQHLLDMAYVDAEHLVTARNQYEVDLVGKVPGDSSWQAKTDGGFDLSCFAIDWGNHQVRCPSGQLSQAWRERTDDYDNRVIEVRFDRASCATCANRSLCTQAKKEPRLLKFRHREQHEALQAARLRQTTPDFKLDYAKRAGVEGTFSQATRAYELRRSRYVGLAKTHLQHIAIAAAMNLSRLMAWWQQIPKAKTRISAFAALGATA